MRMCEGNTSFFMQFCTDDTLTSCFLLSVIVHVKFIFGLYEGLVWFVKACHCSVRCKQSQSLELVTHLADQILCVTWRFHVSLPLFTSVPSFSDLCLGSPWCQYFYSCLFWEKNHTINPQRFHLKMLSVKQQRRMIYSGLEHFMLHHFFLVRVAVDPGVQSGKIHPR